MYISVGLFSPVGYGTFKEPFATTTKKPTPQPYLTTQRSGVEIKFCHLRASRAPTIGNLGALIRISGPHYIARIVNNIIIPFLYILHYH